MLNRRDLIAAAAAALAPLVAQAQTAGAVETGAQPTPLDALLDRFMKERLARSPEEATDLGVDVGPQAGLKTRLSDASPEGVAADKRLMADQLARLRAFDPSTLRGRQRVDYAAVRFGLETRVAADRQFDFGDPGARSPYVLSQLTGAYQSTPTFLDTKHKIATREDADAYLSRLHAFAGQVDGETERAKRDAAAGVIPPDFILDKALTQMTALRAQSAEQSVLVRSLARRAAEKGLSPDYETRAGALYAGRIQPALDRQIAQARAMRARATSEAGVGRLKDGAAYYAAGLKTYTTTSMTADEVHRLGLEQTRAYQAEIDAILRTQGLTQGTVGARLSALSQDPRYLFPDTDAGKAELLTYLNSLVAKVIPTLPRFFKDPPHVPLEIRRVPPYIEAGAPLGYYQSASLDGTRPAIYYINLSHTADWPKWLVQSVTFHEGVPGHHLQISTAQHIPGLPLLRKTGNYSGYAEGWALYAEQLADELGMYEQDPLGRVGYLKSELWRACRMVLDTGIHTQGWSRERAIRWKMDNDGSLESGAVNEVERYCVWPGQAPSYKLGHTVWNRLRDRARAELGSKFDIRDFHAAGLSSGAAPLEVLDGVIGDYIAATRRA